MHPETLTPPQLRQIATEACIAAADTIRSSTARVPIATKSAHTDIVTETDLAAEAVALAVLAEYTPGSRVLGEETGNTTAGDGPYGCVEWVVDPLDGTVNFAYGIPITSVSIAAVVDGRPQAGAIIDIARHELFTAHLGGGADCNGSDISTSTCADVNLTLIGTGFPYRAERRAAHGQTIARLLGQIRDIRTFGSAAINLCWVAMGRLDAYVERDIKPWDHCAGALIAAEAGANVELPCSENDQLILAANPDLYRAIRPLVAEI